MEQKALLFLAKFVTNRIQTLGKRNARGFHGAIIVGYMKTKCGVDEFERFKAGLKITNIFKGDTTLFRRTIFASLNSQVLNQ